MRKILKKPIAEIVWFSVQDIVTASEEIPGSGNIPDNGGIVPDFDKFQ